MSKLDEKIMSEIEKKKIKPLPRWIFLVKNISLYLILGSAIIVGAFAFSFFIMNLGHGFMPLPLFWLVITTLLIFLSFYNYRRMPLGYRASSIRVMIVLLLLAGVLGFFFFHSGFSHPAHHYMQNHFGPYKGLHKRMMRQHCDPRQDPNCERPRF